LSATEPNPDPRSSTDPGEREPARSVCQNCQVLAACAAWTVHLPARPPGRDMPIDRIARSSRRCTRRTRLHEQQLQNVVSAPEADARSAADMHASPGLPGRRQHCAEQVDLCPRSRG
jgi:hypothetical protein